MFQLNKQNTVKMVRGGGGGGTKGPIKKNPQQTTGVE